VAEKQIHILYTVLDWGLGHATRSIPVIQQLLDKGIRVSLAGEGDSLFLLKSVFPDCNFYPLKGLQVSYPAKGSMLLSMLTKVPFFLYTIHKEHQQTISLINLIQPDAIISDSRFGGWSKKIPSIIISHQLWIKAPKGLEFLEPIIYMMNRSYLKRFKYLWTPDVAGEKNITGDLAHHQKPINELKPVYIGHLSRFSILKSADIHERYEMVIVISGPEPQRSLFENECLKQSLQTNLKTLIIKGKPQENEIIRDRNVTIVSHLPASQMKAYMEQANFIVSRSGHSTLMDLSVLGRSALCIPTPGQTEQEYLGELLSRRGQIVSQKQSDFNLQKGLELLVFCIPVPDSEKDYLSIEIDRFIKELRSAN
jgi:uncharacterized protein (TIGR00661 family)